MTASHGGRFTLVAGRLRTMDPEQPIAEAMAILDDRIVGVGDLQAIRTLVPENTPLDRISEGVVLPGLIDAHLHMQRGGLKLIHDLGDDTHPVAQFVATMNEKGFEAVWGETPPTIDERVRALELVQPLLHELGFTGVIDPAATVDELAGYQAARSRGVLTMRVVAMPYPDVGDDVESRVDGAIERLKGVGVSTGFGDDLFRLGGIKVYFDGEGMKSEALLTEPWPNESHGHQRISSADFEKLVQYCAANGWSMGVHAVGGAAVDAVVAAFARAHAEHPLTGRQWQIIHGYLETTEASMAIAAELGVVASVQPSISLRNGRSLVQRLGARAHDINPLRSWIDAGALVAMGSDGPFFPFDPRELIWSSVTRRVRGEDQPVGPEQAITMEEAVRGYTVNAAAASFASDRRGMLRVGYLADWTAFDRDPIEVGPDDFRRARVLRTVVGGSTVYEYVDPDRTQENHGPE